MNLDEEDGEEGWVGLPLNWSDVEMMSLPDYLIGLYVMEHQFHKLSQHIRGARLIGHSPEHTRELVKLRWATGDWIGYGVRQLRRN